MIYEDPEVEFPANRYDSSFLFLVASRPLFYTKALRPAIQLFEQ